MLVETNQTMKKLSLLLLTVFAISCEDPDLMIDQGPEIQAKAIVDENHKSVPSDQIFLVVEEPASFPGGMPAWGKHLENTINYPLEAKKLGVEGQVFLSFIVNEDGSIEDIQVQRGIGAGCDEQAVNALLESPNWIPGKQRGKEVKTKMQVKVTFRLDKEKTNS